MVRCNQKVFAAVFVSPVKFSMAYFKWVLLPFNMLCLGSSIVQFSLVYDLILLCS